MAEPTHAVTFEPGGQTVAAAHGMTILEAARSAGVPLNAPCGGTGTCGGCRVHIPDDPPAPSEAGRRVLSGEEIRRNMRLACQQPVTRAVRVVIPEASRLGDQHILVEGVGREVSVEPNCRKVALRLPEPSVTDQRADEQRLLDVLGEAGLTDLAVHPKLLRDLPGRLRSAEFHPAAVVVGDQVVHVERPTRGEACYGFALDVGTTTLAGYLVDLTTGEVAAVASRTNPQTAYGDDVVARIEYCGREKRGLGTLQGMVADSINEMIGEVCRRAHVRPSAVYEIAAVGNTTMNHLLRKLPVDAIARAPFVAASSAAASEEARSLGLKIHPRGRLYTAPLVASFVGADTVAVILATGMNESAGLSLAIDVGTNGEIVLGTRERLVACSTAAGPAFEGARIRSGMRAAAGAVDRVDLDGDRLLIHTIEDAPAVGLCGTGLIDAVSVLLAAGVIDPTGAMRSAEELADRPHLAARVRDADGDVGFVLVEEDETASGGPILLTQRDVREVQLAKGAIAAGIGTLLEEFGADADDLERVCLAGAFGNLIRPERARAIGLIPDVPLERVHFVGNAAGAGAKMLLVNRSLRRTAEDVARGVEHVELSRRPDFQGRFADSMLFPAPE